MIVTEKKEQITSITEIKDSTDPKIWNTETLGLIKTNRLRPQVAPFWIWKPPGKKMVQIFKIMVIISFNDFSDAYCCIFFRFLNFFLDSSMLNI